MNKELEAIAIMDICNTVGIMIYDIDDLNDIIKFRYSVVDSEKKQRLHSAKLRYNMKGESYFISYKKRYYLDQFARVDWY